MSGMTLNYQSPRLIDCFKITGRIDCFKNPNYGQIDCVKNPNLLVEGEIGSNMPWAALDLRGNEQPKTRMCSNNIGFPGWDELQTTDEWRLENKQIIAWKKITGKKENELVLTPMYTENPRTQAKSFSKRITEKTLRTMKFIKSSLRFRLQWIPGNHRRFRLQACKLRKISVTMDAWNTLTRLNSRKRSLLRRIPSTKSSLGDDE